MDLIQSNLYVSDCESAINYELLQKNNINIIISLGCDIINNISDINKILNNQIKKYISYPNLKDSPEIQIIKILNQLNTIINDELLNNMKVLVHCIYGQSRSITVIISYLISIYNSLSLDDAIEKVSQIRNNICINPGFLCQLYLLYYYGINNAYSNILIQNNKYFNDYVCNFYILDNYEYIKVDINNNTSNNYNNIDTFSKNIKNINSDIIIKCKYCENFLEYKDNIIYPIDFNLFILKYIDNFWKGYNHIDIINHLKHNTICTIEEISKDNTKLVLNGLNNKNIRINNNEILCIQCNNCIGNFNENKLLLLNNYMINDLYLLNV